LTQLITPDAEVYLYVVAAAASLESIIDRTQFLWNFSTKRTSAKMQQIRTVRRTVPSTAG